MFNNVMKAHMALTAPLFRVCNFPVHVMHVCILVTRAQNKGTCPFRARFPAGTSQRRRPTTVAIPYFSFPFFSLFFSLVLRIVVLVASFVAARCSVFNIPPLNPCHLYDREPTNDCNRTKDYDRDRASPESTTLRSDIVHFQNRRGTRGHEEGNNNNNNNNGMKDLFLFFSLSRRPVHGCPLRAYYNVFVKVREAIEKMGCLRSLSLIRA